MVDYMVTQGSTTSTFNNWTSGGGTEDHLNDILVSHRINQTLQRTFDSLSRKPMSLITTDTHLLTGSDGSEWGIDVRRPSSVVNESYKTCVKLNHIHNTLQSEHSHRLPFARRTCTLQALESVGHGGECTHPSTHPSPAI